MYLANHWVTGDNGFTTGMALLALVPYLILGVGAYLIISYLRRDRHSEGEAPRE